jgi:hypothetical protein
MMIVMNFLRGQKAPALKRMVKAAAHDEQERLRAFALAHGLHDLLAVFKPDAARVSPSSKLPGRRRAKPAWEAAAAKSDAIAIAYKPVHLGQNPHLGRNIFL